MKPVRDFLNRLNRSSSGAALVEFALSAPLLLTAGLWGVESANQAIVQMRISQAAILIADNASRIGEESILGEVKVYETDVNDIFYGTHIQTGGVVELFEHGRVILSSLEVIPDDEGEANYIHWQRCMGKKVHSSTYGNAGDGLATGGIPGMGPPGQEIIAFADEAVMFVEISYDYQPLISSVFTATETLSSTAAFNVRNNRNLTQVFQRDPAKPDPVATCDIYDSVTGPS